MQSWLNRGACGEGLAEHFEGVAFAVWLLERSGLVCTNRNAGVGWSSPCSPLSPEKSGSPVNVHDAL